MPIIILDPDCPDSIADHIRRKNRLSKRYFLRPNFAGSFGVYYPPNLKSRKVPLVGIKVISYWANWTKPRHPGYKNSRTLQQSYLWKDALKEFEILQKLKTSKLTPKPFALRSVMIDNRLYPGIFMEHIRGMLLDEFLEKYMDKHPDWDIDTEWIWQIIDDMLHRFGMVHQDTGGSNLVITKHKGYNIQEFRIIDFTPECIDVA